MRVVALGFFRGPLVLIALLAAGVGVLPASMSPSSAVAQAPTALITLDADVATAGTQANATYPSFTPSVSIDVTIATPFSTGAFEVDVLFDSAQVDFLGWQEGAFLASSGRSTTCSALEHEHDVRIGCTSSGAAPPGPAGSGVLATFDVRPRFAGESCFLLILVETADVAGNPLPTSAQHACVQFDPDTDGDGCANYQEARPDWRLGGRRDAGIAWDVFDVPLPALSPGALEGTRDHAVTMADVLGVLLYTGAREGGPVNGNGVQYDSDLNGNGAPDGSEYDRSRFIRSG